MKTLSTANTTLIALVSALTFSTPALAQDYNSAPEQEEPAPQIILNEQIQFGDVFGHMIVHMPENNSGPVESTGLAYGNVANVDVTNDTQFQSEQTLEADVDAFSGVYGGDVAGNVVSSSTAYGNSVTEAAHGTELTSDLRQRAGNGDQSVTAVTHAFIRNADNVTAVATAVDNIIALNGSEGARLDTDANQEAYTDISATVEAEVCCSNDSTVIAATATGNSYDTVADQSFNRHDVTQIAGSPSIQARTRLTQQNGNDVSATTNASGNNLIVDSAFHYSEVNAVQSSTSVVVADSEVTLNNWGGVAAISSNGVGNSAITYSIGSPSAIDVQQFNTGAVYAANTFNTSDTTSGGVLVSSTTAMGNAYTGTVCATCGSNASLNGSVRQVNTDQVHAYGNANVTGGQGFYGSATAVGNSASYATQSGGH